MKADEPVHLVEDAETGDRFLIYDGERGSGSIFAMRAKRSG
ncbi:hypothetical protein [Nitratireductor sp.]|nr:hypothetical protein [Nitratireductor sp.]